MVKKTTTKRKSVTKKKSPTANGAPTTNGSNLKSERDIGEVVSNAMLSRKELFKSFLDPRRDINDECGYPETQSLDGQTFRVLYDREPVATRVVDVLPDESWKVQPRVFETEDIDQVTEFEQAWMDLSKKLRGQSWYQDEEGNPLWEHLRRVDKLSGIGSFGVLLIGVDDSQEDLTQPIEGFAKSGDETKSTSKTRELTFLRAFDESLVYITQYETDMSNPRFGQPNQYAITFNDPRVEKQSGVGLQTATKTVHWSRVIHIADNLGSSETFGIPRMMPVFNRLLDLRKLYGGSAEMYWRGAFPGLSIETHPQLGGDVTIDTPAMRTQMEQYMNGLQRYLALQGITAKSLAPQVVDPTAQIEVQLVSICIKLAIPKRIFTGSERGELASSQDEGTWNDRMRDRQNNYITPRIIIPFIDRMISIGVLPEPEGYSIVWPDLDTLTETEKATVANVNTDAMMKYVQGDLMHLISPLDFLTRVIGFKSEEAIEIVEATLEELQDGDLLTELDDRDDARAERDKPPAPIMASPAPGKSAPGKSAPGKSAPGKSAPGKPAPPKPKPVAAKPKE